MRIEIRASAFDPFSELAEYQEKLVLEGLSFGATAMFLGTMRNMNDGDAVAKMTLEYYPGMTEKHLRQIVETARQNWEFLDALVVHRVGEVTPADPIVLTAVWSAHRGAAFDACRYIMEELKTRAPFWKKETLDRTERWVAGNTSGY